MSQSFLDSVLAGDMDTTDIDDVVEAWHTEPQTTGLQERLGMADDEYELWVFQPSAIGVIVAARRSGKSLADAVNEKDEAKASGLGPEQRSAMLAWLRRTGRVA